MTQPAPLFPRPGKYLDSSGTLTAHCRSFLKELRSWGKPTPKPLEEKNKNIEGHSSQDASKRVFLMGFKMVLAVFREMEII